MYFLKLCELLCSFVNVCDRFMFRNYVVIVILFQFAINICLSFIFKKYKVVSGLKANLKDQVEDILGNDFDVESFFNDPGKDVIGPSMEIVTYSPNVATAILAQRAKRKIKPSHLLKSPFIGKMGTLGKYVCTSASKKFFQGGYPLDDNYVLDDSIYTEMRVELDTFIEVEGGVPWPGEEGKDTSRTAVFSKEDDLLEPAFKFGVDIISTRTWFFDLVYCGRDLDSTVCMNLLNSFFFFILSHYIVVIFTVPLCNSERPWNIVCIFVNVCERLCTLLNPLSNLCFHFFPVMQHINVVLYYMRKKNKYGKSRKNFTTTNDLFDMYLQLWYHNYKDQGEDPTCLRLDDVVGYYIQGSRLACGRAWADVDYVLMPVNSYEHWILVCLDFKRRGLFVYDSIRNEGHDEIVVESLQRYAVLLPYFLENAGVWRSKKYRGKLAKVPRLDPLPITFVDGLPTQELRLLLILLSFFFICIFW